MHEKGCEGIVTFSSQAQGALTEEIVVIPARQPHKN
jgi:hypothetical protein